MERDNHCGAIIGASPIFSVKYFMKKIIFSFICAFFVGCSAEKEVQPVEASPIPPKTLEESVKQPVDDKKGKLDYEAINKDILKDVSKKIVDKASKKD